MRAQDGTTARVLSPAGQTSPLTPKLEILDRLRRRIPFWWWLTYDAAVGLVIALGVSPSDPAFWLGFVVLFVAVVIDAVEFLVKRPHAARPAV